MFRRNSRVVATVVAVSVSGAVLAAMAPAGASPAGTPAQNYDLWGAMDTATDQLDALSGEVVAAQAALVQAEGGLPAAQSEWNAAQSALSVAQSEEVAAREALARAEADVEATKAEVEVKRAAIEELKGALSSFAREVYTSGAGDLQELGVIMGAQDLGDFATGLETIEKVSRGKNKSVDEYTAAKESLAAALVLLEELKEQAQQRRQYAADALSAAEAASSRAASAKASLESLVVQRTQAVGVIEGQRVVVRQQYDDLKAAQDEIEASLRAREAQRQRELAEQARRALEERVAREAAEQAARQAAEQAAAEAAAAQAAAAAEADRVAAAAQQQAQQAAAAQAAEAQRQAQQAAAQAASEQAAAQQAAAQAVADEAAAVEAYRTAVAAEVARQQAAEATYAAEQAAAAATAQIPTFEQQPSPVFVPEPTRAPAVSNSGWVYPVSGGFQSSPPGPRSHPAYGYWSCHKGEDIAAPMGSPIMAARSGTVISAGWNNGGYGILTIIDHGDGTTSLYAHQNSTAVYSGQYVSGGQVIGYVGSTGDSTGPHLHFEILVGGVAYLPSGWFGGAYGPVSC
jgi:murein DD-endopeptidase MepM/ murein hydrolase activator NlpD